MLVVSVLNSLVWLPYKNYNLQGHGVLDKLCKISSKKMTRCVSVILSIIGLLIVF